MLVELFPGWLTHFVGLRGTSETFPGRLPMRNRGLEPGTVPQNAGRMVTLPILDPPCIPTLAP